LKKKIFAQTSADVFSNQEITSSSAIAERERETALQGGLVLAKSGRLELGDNMLRT